MLTKPLFLAALAFLTFFQSFPAFAEIKEWDFKNPENYRCDSQKVEIAKGTVHLTSVAPYRDDKTNGFEKASYPLNTSSVHGAIQLAATTADETRSAALAFPLGAREPGLTALWHLDEPSGTNLLDDVAQNIAKASDSEIVSGQTGFGYARRFDGTKSHVFIPHYRNFKFDGPFTLEAWIRPAAVIHQRPQTIISRWQVVGAQKTFALQISPEGKIDFEVSGDGAVTVHHEGDTVLAAGLWYHVAAVYTGEDLRVYLNGAPDGEPTLFRGPVHDGTNPIYLGALINTRLDEFYEGVIDEVAMYQRALSETETLNHFGNPRGLVALWPLNERAGVLSDASGYGHHAVAYGGPVYEAEGKFGNAVHFNGKDQYLEAPATFRLGPENQGTIEAWIKPDKLPELGQMATILAAKGAATEYSIALVGPDARVRAFIPAFAPSEIVGHTPLMPNVWQHVALTWGQGTARLYVNGVLDTSAKYSGMMKTAKTGVLIGTDLLKVASFAGSLDEIGIYRRAKTEIEIADAAGLFPSGGIFTSAVKDAGSVSPWRTISWGTAIPYGREISGQETGLLHLYSFDETEGAAVSDRKGENAATLIGTYPVGGIFSNARWFQMQGFDKIISQKSFPALSTFTISLWFQFSSKTPGLSDRIFSIGDENPSAFRGPDGRMHVVMPGAREITGTRVLTDTLWHQMTLAADGRDLFLSIDSAPDGSSPFLSATATAPLVLGNLKSMDTFQGAIDDFAFYNYALGREAILRHYLSGNLSLKFLARSSKEESFNNVPWRGPHGTNGFEREAGPFTVGLWHLNETVLNGRAGAIRDASRFANHGTDHGRVVSVPVGAVHEAAFFNGASDYIEVPNSENLQANNQFTLSAWIKPFEIFEEGAALIDKRYLKGAPTFSSYALELASKNRLALRLGYAGGYHVTDSGRDGEVTAGRWNHAAATYDGKEIRIYLNGKLKKTEPFREDIIYDEGSLYLGRYGSASSRFFRGAMDEAAVENHALSEAEILDTFLRADPENFYRAGDHEKLDVDSGRYFQYQGYLETRVPSATPTLEYVEIQPSTFSTERPPVTNLASVSYAEISRFKERPGPNHQGAVSYQISNDGSNWFYHNGRHWVIAAGVAESNTASQINDRIKDFAKELGPGSFYFKAFLHSLTGLDAAELEAVQLEYLANKLTLTHPNGGEAWLVGHAQQIRWNSIGEVTKVTIEYSKDDFKKDFQPIAKDVANQGSFDWTIPEDISTSVKVRVMDALDPRIYDTSDISFRTTGAFEIVSPNWNERWQVGDTHDIVWKTTGKISAVKVEYSSDEFESAIYPVIDSVKNEGKFAWKIPDHISPAIKVRVSDVRDPLTYDQSNDTFSIVGGLAVVSPNAKSRWIVGSDQEILWKNTGTIAGVKLEYQTSAKEDWHPVGDLFPNGGKAVWKIPDAIDKAVKVRVTDQNDKKVFAQSEPFAIIGGLRLTVKGGDAWSVGSHRKITWQTVGTIPKVKIAYRADLSLRAKRSNLEPEIASVAPLPRNDKEGSWTVIEKAAANIGTYSWGIPDALSDAVTVRVTDAADESINAVNAVPLKIIPGLSLVIPNGGEAWQIGSNMDIVWKSKGSFDSVRLEYSKDDFAKDIHEMIASASNIGRFSWTVPDDASKNVRIRIFDPLRPEASDISDRPFRIYGGFKVTLPASSSRLEVGSLATLKWQTLGTIPKVRVEYSHDDFAKDARTISESMPNQGRYVWTVPDDLGSGYQLRVSDANDPETSALSDGHFSVIGSFRLLAPEGGQNYTAGTIVRVKWKGAGSMPFVRIDYSEDNFEKSFSTLADKAPNNGTFEWTVPNQIGHPFKIRIWDPSDPQTMDTMEQPGRVIGGLRLIQPNGGEVLYVGGRQEVTWETFGTIPRIKLEISGDHFNRNIVELADSYENLGRYEWEIPDLPSGPYQLRISDVRDTAAYDLSNSDFRIRSKITLLSPNGGEGWSVGEMRTIRWQTSSSVPDVRLEYSKDDFAAASAIAESAPNNGMFDWAIPNHVSGTVKIRVLDVRDPDASAVSAAPFRILGQLALASPNGGEVWKVGEQRAITWKTIGAIKGIRLEFSTDDFASQVKPIIESTTNAGSYNWTVPDEVTAHAKLRVVDVSNADVFDFSDESFQITPALMVLGPNGGDPWHATEKREINWVTVGTSKEVDLEYSQDDFKTEPAVIDRGILNSGRYIWDIPRVTGSDFKIRVCDNHFPAACDDSDHAFLIQSPFEIVWPKGGELWPVGSEQEIRWNTYGRVDQILLEYLPKQDGRGKDEWKELAEELPNQGHFLFKVPDDISKAVLFRVTDWEDESLFFITKTPVQFIGTFTLFSPNGGEKWAAGTTQKISWDTIGSAANVRLEYSRDDFKNDIQLVESSLANNGSYSWKIPADLSPAIRVRVMDAANPAAFDVSDAPFKIMPGFVLLTPNGGEKFVIGSKQKIKWKAEGAVDQVRLEYCILGDRYAVRNSYLSPKIETRGDHRPETIDYRLETGDQRPETEDQRTKIEEAWMLVADKIPNGGEYEWQVPNLSGKEVLVRISDVKIPDAFDLSDAPFEIRPDLVVTAPNGNENFKVSVPGEIKWATIGAMGKVKIEYSKDEFKRDRHTIAEAAPDKGFFYWTPPDDVTAAAKVRVASVDNADVSDTSDQPFKILPFIKILVPAGGEKWTVGSTQPLSWDWRGRLDRVTLEFSVNDFASAKTIAEKQANTGSFRWEIPDVIQKMVKLKVTDADHPEASAVSEIAFKIMPGFKMISPNGGEVWAVGERRMIEWQTSGTSSRVRLDYAVAEPAKTDAAAPDAYAGSFTSWKTIAEVLRNSGNFEWEIPKDVSSGVKVRVVDVSDGDALDESDAPFKILAKFQLTAPKKDEALFVGKSYPLRWETIGKVAAVKLELLPAASSKDPPAFPMLLESSWNNTGSYYWGVPDSVSEEARLKISDAAEPDAFFVSEPFMIRAGLDFEMPEGKNNWPVGTVQTLQWKSVGTIPSVTLQYSADDGASWKEIAKDIPNSGNFGWTIPDDVAQKVKLKIVNAGNPEVFGEWRETAAIAAQFKLTKPAAGERWPVAAKQTIAWETAGKVQKVWIEYSVADSNEDSSWKNIAGPRPSTGSFEWTIPDAVSTHARVRIRDGDNPDAVSVSEPFAIVGQLEMARPVGGEVWKVGEKRKVEWKTTGTIPKVRIELIQGGENPAALLLADSLANQNRFEWEVPDAISSDLKIRISDPRDAQVTAVSAAPFSVLGDFTLVSPKGGEDWVAGTEHEIAWTSRGTIPNVVLEFSRDDFYRDLNVIASGVPNTGTAAWTIPDSISDNVKIRISDARDPRAFVLSSAPFRIKGALSFTAPAGGEVWTVGGKREILWQSSGTLPNVRLEFSRDDFHRDIQVIQNSLENRGRYEWTLPDVISDSLKFRISKVGDAAVFAVSSAVKVQGLLRLKSPLGKEEQAADIGSAGEVLPILSRQKIVWETVGTIPRVRLEYSRDHFSQDLHPIALDLANQGFYEWTIPDDIGPGVQIRVADAGNMSVFDTTPGNFEILGALALSAGEARRWPVGSHEDIVWTSIGTMPQVRLEYSKDDFQNDIHLIVDSLSNQGKFRWQIPDDISDRVRLRISDARHPQISAVTTDPISITGAFAAAEPAAGTLAGVGTEQVIQWKTTGTVPAVRLEYSVSVAAAKAGEENWKLIAGSVENAGDYLWKVPDDISDAAKIRISDVHDPKVAAVSQVFSITGGLEIAAPAGGERWIVGTAHDLIWSSSGNIPEVKLEFSRDEFKTDVQTIVEKIPNSGRLLWAVPDAISDKVRFRVQDARDARVIVQSPPFAIAGDFIFLAPAEAALWNVASEQKIEWQTVGTIPQVRLEISRDDFAGDIQTIYEAVNDNQIQWKVPDLIADGFRIRVADPRDTRTFALSKEKIDIRGVFEWVRPNAQAVLKVGEDLALAWKTTGTIPEVKLDYSADGFQRDLHPVEDLLANTNHYLWHVPDSIGSGIRLRLRDARHESHFAISEPVRIRGEIRILEPSEKAVWKVGSEQQIKWETHGTIPKFNLEYSLDRFQTDTRVIEKNLEAGQNGINAYRWIVPDAISDQVWVRVLDAGDPSILDTAQEPVKIRGDFELREPAGGEVWTVGERKEISWKTTGSIPFVRLEFSRDGFRKDTQLISDHLANRGSYEWSVAETVNGPVWVRVSDERDREVSASHQKPLRVQGTLALVSPVGGETWPISGEQKIEWKTTGSIPEVRLRYRDASETGEEVFKLIQDHIPNRESFNWQLPEDAPARILLRLEDAANAEVFSETQRPVTILGELKILSPNSKTRWPIASTQEISWQSRGYVPSVKLEYSRDGFVKETGVINPFLKNGGSFGWKIPDLITRDLKIRVSDAANPSVSAVSAAPVEVAGGFRFLAPRGGEKYEVGSKTELSWETLGSIGQVRLEYSSDHFQRHRIILVDQLVNSGRFTWEIPNDINEDLSLRISDASNLETFATTESAFEITGGLRLLAPRSGEIFKVWSDTEIRWETNGTIPFVRLEYSADDFAAAAPIVPELRNEGKHSWHIPDFISDHVRIRVADVHHPSVFSETAAPFKIEGTLSFIAPDREDAWKVGTRHPIEWQSLGSIPYVNLEYSTDNFASTMPVILGLANQGHYLWSVPDLNADHLRFRISDARDQSVFALTKAPVQIGGALEFVAPAGGETWQVGSEQEIRWKTSGTIPKIKLEISTADFKEDVRMLETEIKNSGSFVWKVRDLIHPALWLRISDAQNPKIFDRMRSPFKIVGGFMISSPKGGEVWKAGSSVMIRWQTLGTIPAVRLEYSKDNFRTVLPVSDVIDNAGRYEWEVPDLVGSEIRLKISDASDPSIYVTPIYGIRIRGEIKLVSPQDTQVLVVGSRVPIVWQSRGTIANVTLEYSDNDFRTSMPIASQIPNRGNYEWIVPDLKTRNLKLRVSDSASPDISDATPRGLEVQGSLALASPVGGEVWFVGTEHPILWSVAGPTQKIRLEYTTDDFKTVLPIALDLPNDSKHVWTVPDSISKEVKIKISDSDNPSVMKQMAGPLEIRGALALTSPTGNESWSVGARELISWQTTGTIPQVRLEYSTDDFAKDIQVIVPTLANQGIYYWDVPAISGKIKVRVSDISNADVFDVSRDLVRIAGSLEMLFPNWGEKLAVGDQIEIQWHSSANIRNVKLEYSADDFATAREISSFIPNAGKFVWSVPDVLSSNMRIRVSDAQDAAVFAYSKVPFRIGAFLRILEPKGGEVWTIGTVARLRWQSSGSMPYVRVEYSGDDFQTSTVAAEKIGNTSSYEWVVKESLYPEIRFRVTSAADPAVQSSSEAVRIKGRLELLDPRGGERWIANEEREIRWQSRGIISKVDLEYSKDNFNQDIHLIVSNIPNVGKYSWRIPNDRSGQIRLRLRSAEDSSIFSVSENFQIDYYRVRWILRDARTREHLTGLALSESTGKSIPSMSSPVTLDYPYGIHTVVWTKPGFAEYRSSWLTDHDQAFTVDMEPAKQPIDRPRVNFNYDRDKDVMKITSWYERDGKPVTTVTHCEVRIYDGADLIRALASSNPDAEGAFHLVWDTSSVGGNQRYLASASIATISGQVLTSPISYQLDLPVKEKKAPLLRRLIPSTHLKPVGLPKPADEETVASENKEEITHPEEEMRTEEEKKILSAESEKKLELIAPATAVTNEVISIVVKGSADTQPVIDIYDSNRKLIVRGQPMQRGETEGAFSYLLPLRGIAFIPGMPVHVSVIDRNSGKFKTASILIQSSSAALGMERAIGDITVGQMLHRLDLLVGDLKHSSEDEKKMPQILSGFQLVLSELSSALTQKSLNQVVMDKINRAAEELGRVARRKGYDADYVLANPLRSESGLEGASRKLKDFQTLVSALERLYFYSVSRGSS